MKFKISSANIGYLGLLIFVFCAIIGIVLEYTIPSNEPLRIVLDHTFPCLQSGNLWVLSESFGMDQSIYICGDIKSNATSLKTQIQIRVYKNELQPMDRAIYYDNVWVSNGELKLPIKTQLEPGKYVIQISSGRKSLSIIKLEVINKQQ